MVSLFIRLSAFAILGFWFVGCGVLDHRQLAPGEFVVRGNGSYARDADLKLEAARACGGSYTKVSEGDEPGPAELGHTRSWRIVCDGNSK